MDYTIVVSSLSPQRKGELCVFLSALLWGLFPVVTIVTYARIGTMTVGGISTLIGAAFFAMILTVRGRWAELSERRAWKGILLTSLFTGIIFYSLIFLALRFTTAGNESIMALMEVFSSFLIMSVLLQREPLALRNISGAACMVAGALIILLPKASGWHAGDILVIIAVFFAPFGNRYGKEAREFVSAETIMFCRSIVGGCFLLLLGAFLESPPTMNALVEAMPYLLLNGIMLLGVSKILWIEGIHLIPITKAVSMEIITPAVTLIAAFFILHEQVTLPQLLGLAPMIVGMFLLTGKSSHVPHDALASSSP